MTTTTTRRSWTRVGLVLVALGAFAAAPAAPDEVFTAPPAKAPGLKRLPPPRPLPLSFRAPRGFYESQLAPRMSADPSGNDPFIVAPLGDPASRLWANDPAVAARVEQRTLRSITNAFKAYVVQQLGIDHVSFPASGRGERASPTGGSRGVRFRVGFSRMAPRADVLIPVTTGRVALSVDARGDLRATFDPRSSRFRVAAEVDVPAHRATIGLGVKF